MSAWPADKQGLGFGPTQAALGCPLRPAVDTLQAWPFALRRRLHYAFRICGPGNPSWNTTIRGNGQRLVVGACPPAPQQPDNLTPRKAVLCRQGFMEAAVGSDGRYERLGYALAPDPATFAALYQEFSGANLIFNRDRGDLSTPNCLAKYRQQDYCQENACPSILPQTTNWDLWWKIRFCWGRASALGKLCQRDLT